MTQGGVEIIKNPYNSLQTLPFQVEDTGTSGADAIHQGDPVKLVAAGGKTSTAGGQYVAPLEDGEPAQGTDYVIGVAAGDSSATSSSSGTVEVYLALPGIIYRAPAATGSNLADSIMNDVVTFDYSSNAYTVDEDEGTDDNIHGLIILDYDGDEDTVDFMFKAGVLYWNTAS